MVPGWVTGAAPDVQGKDGERHHVHSALHLSFVPESRVGSRLTGRVINFITCQYWEKKEKGDCHVTFPNSEVFGYSVISNTFEF